MNINKSSLRNKFGEMTILFDAETNTLLYAGFSKISSGWIKRFYPNANFVRSTTNSVLLQFREYFQGQRKNFKLSYRLQGTEFQKNVWKITSEIGYGKTKSYQDIAAQLDKPSAARAVGNALAKNHLLLIIPCHRVIRTDGELGGFTAGKSIKKQLLLHEKNNL